MTTKTEIFANYNAECGFIPHAMQVETKSGQSWMTVHNKYLDGLRELHAVVEQWGFDEIDVVTFKLVPVAPATPAAAPVAAAPAPKTLPKTASPVPLAGLAGFLLVAAGLALRSFRLRTQQ